MKQLIGLAILALVSCGVNRSLIPAIAPVRVLPVGPPIAQQGNAASATKDNSATSGSTLIGCLSCPDKAGKFTLRSMNHRTGVEVLGPDNLKNDSGAKVKLTGNWEAPSPAAGSTEMRRFRVTDVEVMAKTCSVPSETTPVSKNKKQKPTTYNAPSSDSSK
jgi:hypothetical protein